MGKLAIILQRGLSVFFECIKTERSTLIRLHVCGIIRELCTGYEKELLEHDVLHVTCKLINIDPSPDVRALCAEILETLFKSRNTIQHIDMHHQRHQQETLECMLFRQVESCIQHPLEHNMMKEEYSSDDDISFCDIGPASKIGPSIYHELTGVLIQRLRKDNHGDVLEACCKLLETLFCLKVEQFTSSFIESRGWSTLIRCIDECHVRPAALAARALRYLLQNANPEYHLGFKIIAHYPSLSILLNTVVEYYQDSDNKEPIHQRRGSIHFVHSASDKRFKFDEDEQLGQQQHVRGTASSRAKKARYLVRANLSKAVFGSTSPKFTGTLSSPSTTSRQKKKRKGMDLSTLPHSLDRSLDIAKKLLKVELSICIGVIFAQNSICRSHVLRDLKSFPVWISTIKSALFSHLSSAEMDYFNDVIIVDVTGKNLTHQAFHEYDLPPKSAIKIMFKEQAIRIEEGEYKPHYTSETSWDQSRNDLDESSYGKVKSYIISYAIHLAFSVPSPSPSSTNSSPRSSSSHLRTSTESSSRSSLTSSSSQRIQAHHESTTIPEKGRMRQESRMIIPNWLSITDKEKEKLLSMPHDLQQLFQTCLSQLQSNQEVDQEKMSNNELTPRSDDKSTSDAAPRETVAGCKQGENDIERTNLDRSSPKSKRRHIKISKRLKDGLVLLCRFAEFFVDENIEQERRIKIRNLQRELSYTQDPRRLQILKEYYRIAVGAAAGAPGSTENLMLRNYFSATGQGRSITNAQSGFFASNPQRGAFTKTMDSSFHGDGQCSPISTVGTRFQKSPFRANINPLSPQKLQRSWSQVDVREEGDLFEFSLSFDVDFRLLELEKLLRNANRHHSRIKRSLLTCPQGVNGRGRRTFLRDMNQNIMPQIIELLEELVELVRERGEKEARMPIYLWKGKKRQDTTINPTNFVEIFEYLKSYFAGIVHNNVGEDHNGLTNVTEFNSMVVDEHTEGVDLDGSDTVNSLNKLNLDCESATISESHHRLLTGDEVTDKPTVSTDGKQPGESENEQLEPVIPEEENISEEEKQSEGENVALEKTEE